MERHSRTFVSEEGPASSGVSNRGSHGGFALVNTDDLVVLGSMGGQLAGP
ncbi:hypothetical protein [Terrabacter sp. NPDC000476]